MTGAVDDLAAAANRCDTMSAVRVLPAENLEKPALAGRTGTEQLAQMRLVLERNGRRR